MNPAQFYRSPSKATGPLGKVALALSRKKIPGLSYLIFSPRFKNQL
ncbi:hypothetical protein X474_23475 [Dethiosulfatarculus sandiegensis]|uniref:Uncharacterized protein n=1 Tax=Dethiosulfatarculus sandiegensis TaxID=1429043 RepID=A0A0D2IZT8_9BACT|nr:hypothetical protein X474_23475 [Dethiosulfatarculus sandiegensis]